MNSLNYKKYYYVVLFIKQLYRNQKGQAIVFRRKSLDAMMQLVSEIDETYLKSSPEESFQKKQLYKHSQIDFLVKYDNCLENVLQLINPNAYTIKLSWEQNVETPTYPIPPINFQPDSIPPSASLEELFPFPPPYYDNKNITIQIILRHIDILFEYLRNKIKKNSVDIKQIQQKLINIKTVRVVRTNGFFIYVRETKNGIEQGEQFMINVQYYYESSELPDFQKGYDCLLINNLYLLRLDPILQTLLKGE